MNAIEIAMSSVMEPVCAKPSVPVQMSLGSRLEKPPQVTRARLSRATSAIALWMPLMSWLARTTARSVVPSGWLTIVLSVV